MRNALILTYFFTCVSIVVSRYYSLLRMAYFLAIVVLAVTLTLASIRAAHPSLVHSRSAAMHLFSRRQSKSQDHGTHSGVTGLVRRVVCLFAVQLVTNS